MAIAARMPMMATTIMSSIKVKPRVPARPRKIRLLSDCMENSPVEVCGGGGPKGAAAAPACYRFLECASSVPCVEAARGEPGSRSRPENRSVDEESLEPPQAARGLGTLRSGY